MKQQLIERIDQAILEVRDDLVRDTIRMVNIKSVRGEPLPGAPFGEGPRKVLDTAMEMGKEAGFYPEDYGVGVVSVAMKEGQPDLGIWLHGDVVPEGDGWNFEPYNAVEYKNCVIGRGATDNKGQMMAIFHLLKIFKALEIPLKYNPAMYVGSNEESGMYDLRGLPDNPDARGFINVCTPPRLSLVPDSSFPVGYGGKGGLNIMLRSKTPIHGFTFIAGQPSAPGRAEAVFDKADLPDTMGVCTVEKGEKTVVWCHTPPRHGAHPDPEGNMITRLCEALLDSGAVEEGDKHLLDFMRRVSGDVDGKVLGIATDVPPMKPLTVFSKQVDCKDGYLSFHLNIRYPLGITYEEIVERIAAAAAENGFEVEKSVAGITPYLMDPEWPIIQMVAKIAGEITGSDKGPYLLSGGTYAHMLPNALACGMEGCKPPEDFPKGRGGAHGIDEVVSIERLQRAMRIYARIMLELNDMEW
ncbi:MAG: M20/M25/M40 family metallo-hydrolase [Clostridia bacterium]|nr:M20/M25/M40 family metallo-hydrolase [Clostridia bacterium]